MTRITVEIDDQLLAAAREVLGTDTKVATINTALREVARRKLVAEAVAAMNSVEMDFRAGSERGVGEGWGRDLSALNERAQLAEPASYPESA
jgi:Arc/MetJ family transcription regulator